MSARGLPWIEEAQRLGYQTEEEMLRDLYLKKYLSLIQIGKLLGYSHWSVRGRLKRYDIELRSRGGANHTKRKLQHLGEILWTKSAARLAIDHKVSPSTVVNERRMRGGRTYATGSPEAAADTPGREDDFNVRDRVSGVPEDCGSDIS